MMRGKVELVFIPEHSKSLQKPENNAYFYPQITQSKIINLLILSFVAL
jgi:hypothetical protein